MLQSSGQFQRRRTQSPLKRPLSLPEIAKPVANRDDAGSPAPARASSGFDFSARSTPMQQYEATASDGQKQAPNIITSKRKGPDANMLGGATLKRFKHAEMMLVR